MNNRKLRIIESGLEFKSICNSLGLECECFLLLSEDIRFRSSLRIMESVVFGVSV